MTIAHSHCKTFSSLDTIFRKWSDTTKSFSRCFSEWGNKFNWSFCLCNVIKEWSFSRKNVNFRYIRQWHTHIHTQTHLLFTHMWVHCVHCSAFNYITHRTWLQYNTQWIWLISMIHFVCVVWIGINANKWEYERDIESGCAHVKHCIFAHDVNILLLLIV